MSFTNDTNKKRVEKMIDTLMLLAKSAKSNKASRDEFHGIMMPLISNLTALKLIGNPPEAEPQRLDMEERWSTPETDKSRQWADAVQMAREADLEAAVAAMGVIATRVEQELFERR